MLSLNCFSTGFYSAALLITAYVSKASGQGFLLIKYLYTSLHPLLSWACFSADEELPAKSSVSLCAIIKVWYFPIMCLKCETTFLWPNKDHVLCHDLLYCFEYVRYLFGNDSASQEMEIYSILCISLVCFLAKTKECNIFFVPPVNTELNDLTGFLPCPKQLFPEPVLLFSQLYKKRSYPKPWAEVGIVESLSFNSSSILILRKYLFSMKTYFRSEMYYFSCLHHYLLF